MASPFPGMDPYLEAPGLWPNVHNSLIVALRDDLAPRLRPRYYVALEERTVRLSADDLVFVTRPDVAVVQPSDSREHPRHFVATTTSEVLSVEVPLPDDIREVYLEVHTTDTDQVITVIELLSPTNKLVGEGRQHYERKRLELFGTLTHVVEIDLLRAGQPMPVRGMAPHIGYRILVSRASQRPKAELFAFGMQQAIPDFFLPLQSGDDEPMVPLNRMLHSLYDRAGYDLRIDYTQVPPPPALLPDDAVWLDEQLKAAGMR
jgi:hypothetical protein